MTNVKQDFGKWGEDIAVDFLERNGYAILKRNFRADRGEIDIIAKLENTIVFAEVKTGNSHKFGKPEERITRGKQRQLYKIANHFIQQHPEIASDFRFDAVIIDGSKRKYKIRHYKNAFYLFS